MEKITLKDIDFADSGRFVSSSLVKDKLKEEAIKHVKDMVAGVKRDWAMYFFNITEEDLQ